MDFLQIFILSVVQGLTEFLPISSSAHLILVPVFTAWEDQGLAFDLAVHLGSLAAVLWYFRVQIAGMGSAWTRSLLSGQKSADSRLAWAILWGTVPVGLAGITMKGLVETEFRSPLLIAFSLILFGIALGVADFRRKGERTEYDLRWSDVLVVGCAQALALIPGTSRSGITMTAALFMGLGREGASRFSFLLSIPVTTLAVGLQLLELVQMPAGSTDWSSLALAAVLSGISAYLCIHYFLVFIRQIGMQPFVAYRIVLGVLLLVVFW
ncbi:undecaprenyl-diphosphate phosphatase [Desulfurispirillum indicum]|uniref:Undecaprenyl-diphosphatase n=1 Tax=Desulfurispirillum indicum (strain ATCC BAA-1389 / DSM 22839 / S5) TaxID=653733 RepID=E6W4A6_DESIS|nr:undecaprenyl-diphosphate phosphatase [Desulfurispirillum indicum]ADU65880.1 undecaprenol kinase [Desulfurispirillum indicum S5]UCZ57816.1 undecaprenyl-diphosphate phosphatase [Desulfurispirillum indicum]